MIFIVSPTFYTTNKPFLLKYYFLNVHIPAILFHKLQTIYLLDLFMLSLCIVHNKLIPPPSLFYLKGKKHPLGKITNLKQAAK